jgi:hypothetical protein
LYGDVAAPAPGAPPARPSASISAEEIARMVDERMNGQFGNRMSNLLRGTAAVVTRHVKANRATDIDLDAITKLANEKHSGDILRAYEEWDAPEREKALTAEREKEVAKRVDEEVRKRMSSTNFPAAADSTPSTLSLKPRTEKDNFDRSAMMRDLASTFVAAGSDTKQ